MAMFIKTEKHFDQLSDEQLSRFFNQLQFKINAFGLWQSDVAKKATYSSDDFEIIYYIKGGSKTTVGKKQYDCLEDSILILEPYGLNTSINEGKEQFSYYYLHFEIEPYYLHNQFIEMLTKNGHLLYAHEFRDFKEMFARLLLEVEAKEIGYTSIITSGLIRVLVEIIRAQYRRDPAHFQVKLVDSQYTSIVSDALDYIQNHIQDAIKIQLMAKHLGVSTSHLYKAFHHVAGISPTKYIQQFKISKAQKMLARNHRVNQVASALGYSSAYHLSKVFKESTGLSPKQYQKNMVQYNQVKKDMMTME
ncbi:MAG: AraC family transcriptional regulator [Erysipelotrichia bacterium]|nr:AraC family transcriptional regulator [Erysipelotrichia bacterium]NCC54855.1 AraC family transcriptional regulator [Erysipelotrichia bacterium]